MPKRKTSITINEDLWKEWMTFVVNKYGSTRKASEEVEQALKEYLTKHQR